MRRTVMGLALPMLIFVGLATLASSSALGDDMPSPPGARPLRKLDTLRGAGEEVQAATFSRDKRTLVTGSRDGVVRVWDLSTRKAKFGSGDSISNSRFWASAFAGSGAYLWGRAFVVLESCPDFVRASPGTPPPPAVGRYARVLAGP
jgi:hypothetical protein